MLRFRETKRRKKAYFPRRRNRFHNYWSWRVHQRRTRYFYRLTRQRIRTRNETNCRRIFVNLFEARGRYLQRVICRRNNEKLKRNRERFMFETSKLLFVVHRPNDQAGRYSHSIFFPLSIPFFGESPTFGSVAITGLFRMRRPSHDTVIVSKRTFGRRMPEEFDLLAAEREKGCRRVTDGSWHRALRQTEKIKMPTNEKLVIVQIRDDREKNGKNSMDGANVENQASPKQREAPAASEGGSFQISISICPCRCSRDGSRDNDTTTINDSSRVVSRWAPDIFHAKPLYNTPSNIYIVVHAIVFYLICPSKPINERHFPDQRCKSITEITFPNPLHRAFSFTSF